MRIQIQSKHVARQSRRSITKGPKMKLHIRQNLVLLSILILWPVSSSAQTSDRGRSIGPAAFGNEIRSTTGDGDRIKVTVGNGFKTISVKEPNRDVEIVIHMDGRIRVGLTRQFGPDELDALIRRAPQLERYVNSFPKTAGGKTVQLSIGLTTTVEGQNADDLRRQDIAAFNLYQRYEKETSQAANSGGNWGRRPPRRSIGVGVPSGTGNKVNGDPNNPADGDGKKNPAKTGGSKIH